MGLRLCNVLAVTAVLFCSTVAAQKNFEQGEALNDVLSDHTLVGRDWAEYYGADGRIEGKARFMGFAREYTGRWKRSSDTICYAYNGTTFNTCSRLVVNGETVSHYDLNGRLKKDGVALRRKGNRLPNW